MGKDGNRSSNLLQMSKGSIAGFIGNLATLVYHPLDVIKTRMQVFDGAVNNPIPKYNSIWNALTSISRKEGFFSLYRGVCLTFTGTSCANMIFFAVYNFEKERYKYNEKPSKLKTLIISSEAAVIAATSVMPFWTLKTRVILYQKNMEHIKSKNISSWNIFKHVLKDLYRNEGIMALYKGYIPSLYLCLNGIIQMLSYEILKIFLGYDPHSPILTSKQFIPLITGMTAKLISSSLLYPLTTIRSRMQQRQHTKNELHKAANREEFVVYNGMRDVMRKTWMNEGYRGFYQGLFPSLLRLVPASGTFFFFYELTLKSLDKVLGGVS